MCPVTLTPTRAGPWQNPTRPRKVVHPGRAWAGGLTIFIFAITLSPRLRIGAIGGKAIDVRLQDVLLVPTLLMLVISKHPFPNMRRAWGTWPRWYIAAAVVATLLNLLIVPSANIFRHTAFLGRGVEMFLIAAVVAGMYAAAGPHALRLTMRALHLAIWANIAWMAYQIGTGTQLVLFGSLGDSIEAYGPKLIGEPSAFGTGFFCAFAVALGVAEIRTRVGSKIISFAMIAAASVAAFYSQSRVSLVAIAIMLALLTLKPTSTGKLHPFGATIMAGFGTLAIILMPSNLQGRLSPAGIEGSASFRVDQIWKPLLNIALDHPILGIGPGSLGTPAYPATEAHNFILRAALDYGLVGAALLVATVIAVMHNARRSQRVETEDVRLFGNLALLVTIAIVVAGIMQDSVNGVTSSHLTFLAIGLMAGALQHRVNEPAPKGARRQL